MRESMKVICVVIFMVAATACVFVWTDDRPSRTVWALRIACPILSVAAIGLFLMIHFRSDIVPDYLHQVAGTYFNRGGFCFAFNAIPVDDVCCIEAYFQNQHDQPCRGQIALRPARKFLMNRENIESITFEIACEPAGFGIARAYIPLPESVQGKRQSFEVGASVEYLQEKGKQLRFRDGL